MRTSTYLMLALLSACAASDPNADSTTPPGYASHSGALIAIDTCMIAAAAHPLSLSVPGDCASIGAALAQIKAGGTIALAAGTYKENVKITKAVTISGAGKSLTTLLGASSTSSTVHFTGAGSGTLSKLTVKGGLRGVSAGDTDAFGKLAVPGNIALQDVAINSTPTGITGSFSGLTLTNLAITGTAKAGSAITRCTSLKASGSTFSGSSGVGLGIALADATTCVLMVSNSTFSDNKSHGLLVSGAGANLSVGSSKFLNNLGSGAFVSPGIVAAFTGTTHQSNGVAGLLVGTGAGVISVKSATFALNGGAGLQLYGGSHPITIDASNVYGNGYAGVYLDSTTSGNWSITNTTVSSNNWDGIYLHGSAASIFLYGLTLKSNRRAGINATACSPVWIQNCWIDGTLPAPTIGGFGDGIVATASDVTLLGVTSVRNARAGVSAFACGDSGSPNGGHLSVYQSKFYCNAFPIDLESGVPWATASCDGSPGTTADQYDMCGPEYHCSLTDAQVASATWFEFAGTVTRPEPFTECKASSSHLEPIPFKDAPPPP